MKTIIQLFVVAIMLTATSCTKQTQKQSNPTIQSVSKADITCYAGPTGSGIAVRDHIVGIGYSVADLNSDTFLKSDWWTSTASTSNVKSVSYTLDPGVYYYKYKMYCGYSSNNDQSSANCQNSGVSIPIFKTGSFTITTGTTTTVNISL